MFAFFALDSLQDIQINWDETGNEPAQSRLVVLRESSAVLGSLASGALSPNGGEALRPDR